MADINHPSYYGGDTTYEAIKVIEAWQLGFCLGNTVKYISRAGKKNKAAHVEDLEKAAWYLAREIASLKIEHTHEWARRTDTTTKKVYYLCPSCGEMSDKDPSK